MDINAETIRIAKTDERLFNQIYVELFKNIDALLHKYNVYQPDDMDELKSRFNVHLVNVVYGGKYKHEKIDFMRWINTKFIQIIIDFHRKNSITWKRLKLSGEIDLYTIDESTNLGNDDVWLDIECILSQASEQTIKIAKFLLYSDMNKTEILKYLDITAYEYKKSMMELRELFKKYFSRKM